MPPGREGGGGRIIVGTAAGARAGFGRISFSGGGMDRGLRYHRQRLRDRHLGGRRHGAWGAGMSAALRHVVARGLGHDGDEGGGAAGGFAGGIVTAIWGIPGAHTAMALMTASMAGTVGGVLGGGRPDGP